MLLSQVIPGQFVNGKGPVLFRPYASEFSKPQGERDGATLEQLRSGADFGAGRPTS